MINDNDNEKITREVNEVLIDRIRKYPSQDISQLINSPNDEDTTNSYFGGLINFVGDNSNNLDDEINNDLDKITIDEIFIEPQPDNEYNSELTEEEEEENESQETKNAKKENKPKKNNNNKIVIETNNNNEQKEESSFINPFLIKKNTNSEGIRVLLTENFNNYLDLIGNNYEKYDNNHFPKIIVNDKNTNTKKVILNNLRNKIYYTNEGTKIIVNDEIYNTSLAYLKNKEIYASIPKRFKKDNKEFTLDFNLLDETIDNIMIKNFEFIEINKLVSTSMSKITLYCTQLNQYVKDKLEPFNNSINISYEKINRKKQIVSEIKNRTLKNSGDIILKKIKMNNYIKLFDKFKRYLNIKKIMNNLETLIKDPKNYQKTFDLINKCKEEIDAIKNDGDMNKNKKIEKKITNELKDSKKTTKKARFELKDSKLKKEESEEMENEKEKEVEVIDPIVNLFENRLNEFRNENDTHMSGEFSQVLNNYFNNFLIIESEEEVNINKKEKIEEFEKYNYSKFVIEKVSSFSDKHNAILISLYFPSPKEELEKMNIICDYYIEGNLINKIYTQLKGIFTKISEETMSNILSLLNKQINSNNENENELSEVKEITENGDLKEIKEQNGKTENKNELNKINEGNDKNEICILMCVLLSKDKLVETITSFIEVLLKKIETTDKIDKTIQSDILKEIQEIKISVNTIINNILLTQIQKCLHVISSCDNIDLYINNFYLALEMLQNQLQNYTKQKEKEINNTTQEENNNEETNNNDTTTNINDNELAKLIIEEQKYFIDKWLQYHLSKFDSEIYKSWEALKEMPTRYQNILNVFFNFDINNNCMKDEFIITKFPSDKIKLIKDAEEEEEEDTSNNSNGGEKENLLYIKDGEKPEIKLKINQTSLEIIKFSFELLKMFTIFHKDCYGFILENSRKIINFHLNYQIDQIYGGKCGFSVSQQEISMTNAIFLLIEYIYEHVKNSDFFVTVAQNSEQTIYDNYLDVGTNINECCGLSKSKIEEFIEIHCINETLEKLHEIKLPYYNVISGDVPVNYYALNYISSLRDIYNSMSNCYEEQFMKEMINKALDDFFDKLEDYICHGKKIEDENCLRQFKKDMVFLKKNLGFITIMELTDLKNRIDNINKRVLPEWLRPKKK